MSDARFRPSQPVPAVRRLARSAIAGRWRTTGDDLLRAVAEVTSAGPGRDLLVIGCGEGVSAEWLAARTGAIVTAVDDDQGCIARADRRQRARHQASVVYQRGQLADLPHETSVFDATVAEPSLSAADDVGRAIAEAVRVTRPMGVVALLQPTCTSELGPDAAQLLLDRLGVRPRLVVQWKKLLRAAGVVEIQVQDWTGGGVGGVAPHLAWHQKVHIVGRAWRRWGWREARGAVALETRLLRELSRERGLGLHLIHGVKWPHAAEQTA